MFFSIGSHFGGGRRELGCREMKKKKEIEKLGLRVNLYFPLWIFLRAILFTPHPFLSTPH